MSGGCTIPEPTLCGCCEGVGPETPEPISNAPALPAISYRVGRHATFKASMLAALADPNLALGALRTRAGSDFTIALIDAWAVAADILSFYNERLANESYLRTALDSRSVFELARLVGYRPSPGVAASAKLAILLNDAPGSPDNVLIPAGTRVQSIPGPGQTPQVFESSQDVEARIAYNALPVQAALPWSVSAGATASTFAGAALNLNPGDALLFLDSAAQSDLASGTAALTFVVSAVADAAGNATQVTWDAGLPAGFGQANSGVAVYVFRKKAALFGAQAPDPRTLTPATTQDWTYTPTGTLSVNLDAVYPGLAPQTGGEPQWCAFVAPAATAVFQISSVTESGPVKYTLTTKTTQVTFADAVNVLVNSTLQAALIRYSIAVTNYVLAVTGFGNIGAAVAELDAAIAALIAAYQPPAASGILADIVDGTRSATAYVRSERLIAEGMPYAGPWAYDGTYTRQAGLLLPLEGANVQIAGGQDLAAGQAIAITGKRMRLEVTDNASASFVPSGQSGALAVGNGQAFRIESFPPDGTTWQVTTESGITGALDIPAGAFVLAPSTKDDPAVSESAVVNSVTVAGPFTILALSQPLSRIYDRATATVNANVVASTHGETMHEILGSADASNPALQFSLKQAPLTYVSSATALGSQSTLQVWVNNLKWAEAPNFLDAGPADRIYVTRTGPDSKAIVQFGDGVQGTRPPSGQMNVRAQYRKGIGSAGNVTAGQLSQAIDRPQGLKSVFNPDAAAGGADPDTADQARQSAPLHVLTLDRVVSLEDYENFARAFAGIAKALATWTWFNRTRGVFLTVAGAGGVQFDPTDDTVVNLATALKNSGNPFVPLAVASFTPVLFEVAAKIRIDTSQYLPEEVLGRVWQALSTAFSFDNRELGQGVAQSEVIALIQAEAGVIAVELTAFNRSGEAAALPLPAVLRAASPVSGGNVLPQPAEMLLLDPASQTRLGAWS